MEGSRRQEWYFWCLGSALYAHVMGFWGIDYFDLIRTWWYIFLAMIPAATLAAHASIIKQPRPIVAVDPNYEVSMSQSSDSVVQERHRSTGASISSGLFQ